VCKLPSSKLTLFASCLVRRIDLIFVLGRIGGYIGVDRKIYIFVRLFRLGYASLRSRSCSLEFE